LTKSLTTPDFWTSYRTLPPEIKRRARAAYRLWQNNPRHPSPCFKKVGEPWSVRVGKGYRALALLVETAAWHGLRCGAAWRSDRRSVATRSPVGRIGASEIDNSMPHRQNAAILYCNSAVETLTLCVTAGSWPYRTSFTTCNAMAAKPIMASNDFSGSYQFAPVISCQESAVWLEPSAPVDASPSWVSLESLDC